MTILELPARFRIDYVTPWLPVQGQRPQILSSRLAINRDRLRGFYAIEQQVVEKLRDLPPEKRKEVLDFLKEKNGGPKKPRRSLRGLWADLNTHITEEGIAEAGCEMWGNFARDVQL